MKEKKPVIRMLDAIEKTRAALASDDEA